DTEADPWEVHNLATDPARAADLQRLRDALDAWRDECGDLGDIPEAEMVRRWYPDGTAPQTAAPLLIPICDESPGTAVAGEGGAFAAPVLLQMHCTTQGASIAYTLDEGDDVQWQLYTQPLRLPPGTTTVRARAIRIGYDESDEARTAITVVE
ncbi:chitobiase/beta-hexosaminidase C-terminal domain-containing protein, partial [bacterium]|nr:chitobiase/beta-hexosaminidase C-terminal domain-containing protein [bacterium]